MSNSKNYNRMVFLTTLSVYLGLVLVGATPPVMAHAALTQRIEIQNEIETDDDLDKKPDDESIDFTKSIDNYFEEVGNFVKDLQKLHNIEKFDLDYDKFEINELGFVPCNVNGDPVRHSETSKNIDNRWLEPAITDARYSFEGWHFLSDCLKDTKFKTGVSTSSGLKLIYDKSELKIEISAFKSNPQRAERIAQKFGQALKLYEIDEEETVVKQLQKFTSFKSENNQVFIVTRLPRASIDALLAEKNAK